MTPKERFEARISAPPVVTSIKPAQLRAEIAKRDKAVQEDDARADDHQHDEKGNHREPVE